MDGYGDYKASGKYTTISLEGLDDMQSRIVDAVIHEGELRENDRIVALLERKLTEAYSNKDQYAINFIQELLNEIETI